MSTRILLALTSPALVRVVEHLLHELPGSRIVDRSSTAEALQRDALRLAPDVIVTSARMLGRESATGAARIKGQCPTSKLIVITSDGEWQTADARGGAADASLDEEDLVRGLLPIVHTLVAGAGSHAD
jgi:DNA-binding NarL/FixJ family response regulator